MKKKLLPLLILFLLSGSIFADTYTLKVTVPDTVSVCYASGDFNGWSQPGTIMNKVSDNPKVYTLDIVMTDTVKKGYKFCAGPDWYYQQNQSANFLMGNLTADGDIVDGFAAYWNSGMSKDVTFDVLVPDSIFVVYVTGSYNGWSGIMDKMDRVDSTTDGEEFTKTITILDTTTLQYKFSAGPGWDYQQTADNFVYATVGSTVTCDAFTAIYNPALVGDITVTIVVPDGTPAVWLIGSFNGWSTDSTTAIKATKNEDGTYTAVIPQVQNVQYKCYNFPDWTYEECIDSTNGPSLPDNRAASYIESPTVSDTVLFWKQVYVATGIQKQLPASYSFYSRSGSIIVEGVNSKVAVYDIMGRVLQSSNTRGTFVSSSLKSGIYIVRADEYTRKVYVW